MTLKEKYTIKNKKRMKQFIFLYSVLVIFFAVYSSLAKYEKKSEGYIKIAVANWKIALNGKELAENNNVLTDSIVLIPTTYIDAENPLKVMPGQSGYFDIEINPADTEVSFCYQINLNVTNNASSSGFSISSYSLDGGATVYTLPDNKTVSDTVSLGGRDRFTEQDTRTIRYYWIWDMGDEDISDIVYTITADVEAKQVI